MNTFDKFSDEELKKELKRRSETKAKEAYKKKMSQPYKPGKPEVKAQKRIPCYPTCRDQDLWKTAYWTTCNVCGEDWT
jgi:hypothetical protein